MAAMDTSALRTHMIDGQMRVNNVNDERILEAVQAIPREKFVPKARRGFAYIDEDIEIAPGRFLLEPMVFARMVNAAAVQPGDLILDIGCGTGYSAAVLAQLADAVVALESDSTLASKAEETLAALDVINVAVVESNMAEGVAKQGPYDVIFINGSVEMVPDALIEQLSDGGRLVCVKLVRGVGRIHQIERDGDMTVAKNLFDANVAPLPGFQAEKGFVF